MHYHLKLNKYRLNIFQELRTKRIFVGELLYNEKEDRYELLYDKKYIYTKKAISLGPNLSLFQLHHISEKGKMFPFFLDRIPDPENPAYPDYCASQGIDINEDNLIVLLGSIGKRGPSCFIFETVYESTFNLAEFIKWRAELEISQHDFALAFDFSKATLQRIEDGKSIDHNTLKRLEALFSFPEVALWQLKQTGGRVHFRVLEKLIRYFSNLKPLISVEKTKKQSILARNSDQKEDEIWENNHDTENWKLGATSFRRIAWTCIIK